MQEIKIEGKKINTIKVEKGKMECVGDVFVLTGDFIIEFNVVDEK